jgi:hypothetical protein
MLDNNLFLRTAGVGSLTQTETTSGVEISRTPIAGLSVGLILPKQSVGDQITAKLQHSTDNSTFSDLVSFVVSSVSAAITDTSEYRRRFATELKYVRLELTVAGTSPDYGGAIAYIADEQWNTLGVGAETDPTAATV